MWHRSLLLLRASLPVFMGIMDGYEPNDSKRCNDKHKPNRDKKFDKGKPLLLTLRHPRPLHHGPQTRQLGRDSWGSR
jgi:hypothetical protein